MLLTVFAVLLALLIAAGLSGLRYVPHKRIGIVEKRWSRSGSVHAGLIALEGEAGFQPEVLRGGLHYRIPLQYRVHILPLVTIPQGQIGYIFARDGEPLPATQALACNVSANNFEDVRHFLRNGGQRGPQRKVLREGTYAINLAQFVVITAGQVSYLPLSREDKTVFEQMASEIAQRNGFVPLVIMGADDALAIITVHDGPALPAGEIIAPVVGINPADAQAFHNNFHFRMKFVVGTCTTLPAYVLKAYLPGSRASLQTPRCPRFTSSPCL